jgi:hypothetical protein
MTFEQHILHKYGKSVFQIKLEVAIPMMGLAQGVTHKEAASLAWTRAEAFIDEMRLREPVAGPAEA